MSDTLKLVRVLIHYARHADDCDRAAYDRSAQYRKDYPKAACSCGLADRLKEAHALLTQWAEL